MLIYLLSNNCRVVQEWRLEAPSGYFINLTFTSFDLEPEANTNTTSGCAYDYVEIINGAASEKFCGSTIPGPFTSNSSTSPRYLTIRIHTDSSRIEYAGFSATWRASPASADTAATSAGVSVNVTTLSSGTAGAGAGAGGGQAAAGTSTFWLGGLWRQNQGFSG